MVIREEVLNYYAGEKVKISKAVERYNQLRELLQEKRDKELLEMLDDVVRACRRYVEAVIRMEYKAMMIKKKYGTEDPCAWKLATQYFPLFLQSPT